MARVRFQILIQNIEFCRLETKTAHNCVLLLHIPALDFLIVGGALLKNSLRGGEILNNLLYIFLLLDNSFTALQILPFPVILLYPVFPQLNRVWLLNAFFYNFQTLNLILQPQFVNLLIFNALKLEHL